MLTRIDDAAELVAAEPDILAHMNADHADTCRLYATKLLGAPDGDWRCAGCDPEGLELQCERTALRLPFRERVRSPGVLRQVLKQHGGRGAGGVAGAARSRCDERSGARAWMLAVRVAGRGAVFRRLSGRTG